MGLACALATNSPDVLAAARATFRQTIPAPPAPDFTLRLAVQGDAESGPPSPQACFRGLNHLVYVGFGGGSTMLLDLRRRRALGRFSPALAADAAYWQRVILPNAVGLMSEALGLTALHCASVEKDGAALLLAGGSGAGKSTLSLALARRGFGFVSDDWTYFSHPCGRLRAWHIATPLKLLPDAARFFPELGALRPHLSLNGEVAYEADPETVFGVRRALECEPRWLVFIERRSGPGHRLTRVAPGEAAARLEHELEELPVELAGVSARQSATVLDLAGRECWALEHGESPEGAAAILAGILSSSRPAGPGPIANHESQPRFHRTGPDILRRFTPTPWRGDFEAGFEGGFEAGSGAGPAVVRLETDSPAILRQVAGVLRVARAARAPQFLWRLVAEPAPRGGADISPSPHVTTAVSSFKADGLQLDTIAEIMGENVARSFFAVDADARLAVGFLAESLVSDGAQFREVLARLISATAAALAESS
jgi:hypothetical protein